MDTHRPRRCGCSAGSHGEPCSPQHLPECASPASRAQSTALVRDFPPSPGSADAWCPREPFPSLGCSEPCERQSFEMTASDRHRKGTQEGMWAQYRAAASHGCNPRLVPRFKMPMEHVFSIPVQLLKWKRRTATKIWLSHWLPMCKPAASGQPFIVLRGHILRAAKS